MENQSMDIEKKVKEITAALLKVDESQINSDSEFVKDLGAESIQSIELVAAFEEGFDIEMDEDAALSVDNVGKAAAFIEKVMQEQGKL